MFKRKPKKLTLRQIHELYLLLKPSMPEKEEEFLKDQARYMLRHMEDSTLESFLEIVYGKKMEVNPLEAAAFFLKGLKETNFFAYTEFVRKLHGR